MVIHGFVHIILLVHTSNKGKTRAIQLSNKRQFTFLINIIMLKIFIDLALFSNNNNNKRYQRVNI